MLVLLISSAEPAAGKDAPKTKQVAKTCEAIECSGAVQIREAVG